MKCSAPEIAPTTSHGSEATRAGKRFKPRWPSCNSNSGTKNPYWGGAKPSKVIDRDKLQHLIWKDSFCHLTHMWSGRRANSHGASCGLLRQRRRGRTLRCYRSEESSRGCTPKRLSSGLIEGNRGQKAVYLPVPDSGTICGLPAPLSLTIRSPVCGVVLGGLNVTFTSQVWPGFSFFLH